MSLHKTLQFSRSIVLASALLATVIGARNRCGADVAESTDEYPSKLHDPNCNIVIGKVLEILSPANAEERIEATIASDMRGTLRSGMRMTVLGPPTGIVSSGSYMLDVKVGDWAVFVVRPRKDSIAVENVPMNDLPFAVNPSCPAIPERDIPLVGAALKELKIYLTDPHSTGMPKARARALIESTNPYLWSLGCWSLAHDAEIEDIRKLISLFTTQITPRQALFLDDVFDHVTGNASAFVPTLEDRRRYLRMMLARYVEYPVGPATRPAGAEK